MTLPALAAGRLSLRPCSAADAPDLLSLFEQPGVKRFLFDGVAPAGTDVTAMLANWAALAPRGLGGWTIRHRGAPTASRPLGWAALLPVGALARSAPRLAGEVEPMLALAEEHWGRGSGRDALSALTAHAFGTLRLPRLVAAADAPNERSVRALLDAGFAPDGEAPGPAHTLRLFRSGRPREPRADAGS